MSSAQHLREFIRERLTAAAQEIFTEVEKTIISYEEELDAQRRMMGINWKPEMKLHRVGSELQRQSSDLQQPSVVEEEASAIQQVCSKTSRSNEDQYEAEHQWTEEVQMEPEPKWIKEEEEPEPTLLKHEEIEYPLTYVRKEELDSSVLQHEQQPPELLPTGQDQKDLCSSQEGEQQTVQKQFVTLTETSTLQEDDMNEEETRTEQLSLHISPVVERKYQEGSSCSVSESQSDNGKKKNFFKCDICGRCYTQQCKLKNHFKTHTGERPFSCETCGKSFSLIYVLNRHKTIHTGERPFSCQLCGKRFSRLGNLKDHKRTHTGEKPFSCQSCGKSFCQMGILNRHKAIHTGEKPFSCQSCGKSFCQMSILNRHKAIHTSEKPFPCQTCGRRFNRRDNLSMHMKTHIGRRLL